MNPRLEEMMSRMMEVALNTTDAEMAAAEQLAAAGSDESVVYPHLEAAAEANARYYALESLAAVTVPVANVPAVDNRW